MNNFHLENGSSWLRWVKLPGMNEISEIQRNISTETGQLKETKQVILFSISSTSYMNKNVVYSNWMN